MGNLQWEKHGVYDWLDLFLLPCVVDGKISHLII